MVAELASLTSLETNVILDKSNKEWQRNMTTGVRHYLYPVHLSQVALHKRWQASVSLN
jgi:hypothetical protein